MKIMADIEVPLELEGSLNQVAAKFGIKPSDVLEVAMVHVLRRVNEGMILEKNLAESLSGDVSLNQGIQQKASHLILHMEKCVADTTSLTDAVASILGVKLPEVS